MSQRVVITGGASGIGAEVAAQFLKRGDRVAVCDADGGAVSDFSKRHPDALCQKADVRDESEMAAFFDAVETRFGGVDVVCANAGTGGPAGPIEVLDYQDWQNCVGVNLFGAFLTCRWAARIMKEEGAGLIVLTSSTSGQWGHPNRSPYAASKWGIIGLMKTLAMELGPAGVRVNAICPGAVEGARMERMLVNQSATSGKPADDIRADYARGTSMKTWVTARDVAETVLWLASPAAGKISGQAIAIDGHTETNSA